ncbi:SdpI family protein [Paenibacillaceae bacterium WGS1546]|uniref:SdpI family protein n=1 Tax=Cohnella sp. WGS1546 TaxID=3366810 RepID=UPI00372D169E
MTPNNEQNPSFWTAKEWLLLGMNVAIFAAIFLIFNNRLPDQVIAQYNFNNEANRMMSKGSFWLMYAALGVALPSVLSVMRRIDPRKQNYARFEGFYQVMRWGISLFLHSLMVIVILDNMGHKMNVSSIVTGAMGLLWIVIGNRMGQVRSTYFVGIRTPWALSDDRNWRLTHRLAGRLWVIAGIVMFGSAWFASGFWAMIIMLVCILGSTVAPAVYSYLLYRNKANA